MEQFKNGALFFSVEFGLPCQLIRHENQVFRKRSSNQRHLKTPAFRFSIKEQNCEMSVFKFSSVYTGPQGHVTGSNFSCNLQRNVCCVASCKKKFTCNTPFCNCNCCVASCKKSRTILYFSKRCEASCLRVTSPQQLATQFRQNGPIRAHLSLVGDFNMRPPSCLLLYALQVAETLQTCDIPSAT